MAAESDPNSLKFLTTAGADWTGFENGFETAFARDASGLGAGITGGGSGARVVSGSTGFPTVSGAFTRNTVSQRRWEEQPAGGGAQAPETGIKSAPMQTAA